MIYSKGNFYKNKVSGREIFCICADEEYAVCVPFFKEPFNKSYEKISYDFENPEIYANDLNEIYLEEIII